MERSKEEREAEINAKIKAIRAANEARERRHAEVEADKKQAEKSHASVTSNKPFSEDNSGQDVDGKFHSPYGEVPPANRRTSGGGVKSRLGPVPAAPEPARHQQKPGSTNRLTGKDGPPPDPGYK